MYDLYQKLYKFFCHDHNWLYGLVLFAMGLFTIIGALLATIIILFEPETQTLGDMLAAILAGTLFLLVGAILTYSGMQIMKGDKNDPTPS